MVVDGTLDDEGGEIVGITRRSFAGALASLGLAARGGADAAVDGRPLPIRTKVGHLEVGHSDPEVGSVTVTTITRIWAPGDPARCGRCRECAADHDVCSISMVGYVPRGEAPDFRSPGPWREGGVPGHPPGVIVPAHFPRGSSAP